MKLETIMWIGIVALVLFIIGLVDMEIMTDNSESVIPTLNLLPWYIWVLAILIIYIIAEVVYLRRGKHIDDSNYNDFGLFICENIALLIISAMSVVFLAANINFFVNIKTRFSVIASWSISEQTLHNLQVFGYVVGAILMIVAIVCFKRALYEKYFLKVKKK